LSSFSFLLFLLGSRPLLGTWGGFRAGPECGGKPGMGNGDGGNPPRNNSHVANPNQPTNLLEKRHPANLLSFQPSPSWGKTHLQTQPNGSVRSRQTPTPSLRRTEMGSAVGDDLGGGGVIRNNTGEGGYARARKLGWLGLLGSR
jgi:hypothetical protein